MKAIKYLVVLLVVTGCERFSKEDKKQETTTRIVCIAKQYNEIICALGAQKDLVAVDVSSTYPAELKELPTVGYHRALSLEAILASKPTIVIEDDNIGPETVVDQLKKLKVPMKQFGKYEQTIAGTDSLIHEMGRYFKREKAADSICITLKNEFDEAIKKTNAFTKKTRVLVIHYGQASNVYLVMTKNSTGGKMIEWAGGEIAIDEEKGIKHLSPELVAAANPDVILITDFGYDKLGGSYDKIGELPGVSSTKAYKDKKIYRIEEHDLVYLGPRTGKNIQLIQKLIHQ